MELEQLTTTLAMAQELQAILQDSTIKRVLSAEGGLVIEVRQKGDYLLKRQDVIDRLQIGENKCTELIKNGTLKPLYLPGDKTMKFRNSDIEALIEGMC